MLFLLPAILIFGFFVWYPIFYGFVLSFQKNAFYGTPTFAGWQNYTFVLHDPLFWMAWRNSAQYALYGLLIGYLLPIVSAIAINELRRGTGYFRLAFYLPVIIPPLVTAFLWRYMYTHDGGLINSLLAVVHVAPQPWLQSPSSAMASLVIVTTWANMGGTVLIYLAALQSIPAQLYEAAELDGASIWGRIWNITLPQIRGMMLILLLIQIIATVQVFTEPFTLTGGGPDLSTMTVLLLLYNYAFNSGNFGAASALSVILFMVLVVLSLIYFGVTRRLNLGGE
ncbi:MAG: sugar ABC transporter permease [Ktedonobacterales bacterium]|nr:sugar ABC transporter permease [Ktedonobacterales bacterium]